MGEWRGGAIAFVSTQASRPGLIDPPPLRGRPAFRCVWLCGHFAGELLKKGPNGPVVILPIFSLGRVNLYEGSAEGTS